MVIEAEKKTWLYRPTQLLWIIDFKFEEFEMLQNQIIYVRQHRQTMNFKEVKEVVVKLSDQLVF